MKLSLDDFTKITDNNVPLNKQCIFVGIDVQINNSVGTFKYTTDCYCGWKNDEGEYIRWTHGFPPTHFIEIEIV